MYKMVIIVDNTVYIILFKFAKSRTLMFSHIQKGKYEKA